MNRGLCVSGIAFIGILAQGAQAQTTGFNQTAAGPWDYNTAGNWVGGNINGVFDSTLVQTATQAVTFATNTTLTGGLTFSYGGNIDETLRANGSGPYTLTLGGDILLNTVNARTVTLGSTTGNQNLNVDLGGAVRTLTVTGAGNGGNFARTLVFANTVSNGGIIVSGGNTGGGRVSFNSLANTFSSVTVKDAEVAFNGSSTANTVETISGALTVGGGAAQVTLAPNGAKNVLVQAGSFVRNGGGTVLFRGANLGVNTIASATAGSGNISFTTGPTLSGGGGAAGTSTISILAGAYGDTSSTGTGFGATGGLVTYDAAKGVRLLAASEYSASIVDGQTQLDNVRLANSSGVISTTALTAATTTINSLSLDVSGATGNQGITVNGTGGAILKLNSGVIYANQSVTGTNSAGTDAMTLGSGLTIDLNGQEGIVLVNTKMNTGGTVTSNGALIINSTITNGTGLTLGDGVSSNPAGMVVLGGATANTYTGNTTINGAVVQLNKSTTNTFGNIVVNLGYLYDTGNQVADTANVEVNGGIFYLNGSNNSGSATSETINNLTITGGGISSGSGTGNTLTVNGSLALSGGSIGMPANGKMNVAGTTALSGGVLTVSSSGDATFASKASLTGALNLNNTALGTYTPVTLAAGSAVGRQGGQLALSGGLNFTGNSTNSNTATIAAPTGTGNQGTLALNGANTFNIGNGAADIDLAVNAPLVNGSSTGSLLKTGQGTLALNGVSTYTGATTVSAGTLLVNGALSGSSAVTVDGTGTLGGTGGTVGAVTVASGGTLSPGASIGTLNTSSVDAQNGSILKLELNTGTLTADLLNVSGAFNINSDATLSLVLLGTDTVLTLGQQFTLVDYGTWNNTAFAGYADNSVFTLGLNTYQIDYNNGTALTLTTVAVPEPSTYALLGLGLGALWMLRRRRSRAA